MPRAYEFLGTGCQGLLSPNTGKGEKLRKGPRNLRFIAPHSIYLKVVNRELREGRVSEGVQGTL